MQVGTKRWMRVGVVFSAILFLVPQTSFAQVVPVKDDLLIATFKAYASAFGTYASKTGTQLEDLKTMIAGVNNSGKPCEYTAIPNEAVAYTEGPWHNLAASSSGHIPENLPVEVNTSDSLRCLLLEMTEWQKLGLSIQIHSLLKSMIADAQARQLNNQLLGKISAAKLRWAGQGVQVTSKGGNSTSPVYDINAGESINKEKLRRFEHLTAQATGDPDVDDFGINPDWKYDVAADTVRNNILNTEDPIKSGPARMKSSLPSGDFSAFSSSFNAPGKGGWDMFMTMLNDPTSNPAGAVSLLDSEAKNALALQEEATKFRKSTTGADADVECSGLPGDPYCLSSLGTAVTPQFQNQRTVSDAVAAGDEMVANADNLDGGAGKSAEQESVTANTAPGGLLGYDETDLLNQKTAVNDLVREFYDVIHVGYYGMHSDTQKWAQATMLMIYDEMKFDPAQPDVVVTDDHDPVDIDY